MTAIRWRWIAAAILVGTSGGSDPRACGRGKGPVAEPREGGKAPPDQGKHLRA